MLALRIRTGNQTGKTFRVKDDLKIGRGGDCQIQIKDSNISRDHAFVFVKEDRVYIRDLGSKNGTFLEGESINEDEKEIRPGSVITIGDIELVLEDAIDESELIGQRLGGYRVLELVGKGGMGVVFKANQLSLDRIVALKVLNKSLVSRKDLVERFLKEARAAGILNHPNLIQVHDVGKEEETYFFSMEFVDGSTIASVLRRTKNFSERIAVHVIKEVAKALEYAHGYDLIHRDIKPSNIMVDNDGNVKLADLGIAETLRNIEDQDGKGHLMGTPEYMSPEQAKTQPTGTESDIYSLGATLYHMVTGRAPFKGKKTSEIIKKVRSESPPPLAGLAPEMSSNLVELVENMMAREEKDRVPSASEVIRIIEEKWHWHPEQDSARRQRLVDFISGIEREKERKPEPEPKISIQSFPLKNLIAGGAAVLVLIAVVTAFLVLRDPKQTTSPTTSTQDEAQKQYLKDAWEAYRELEAYWQDYPEDFEGIERLCRAFLSKYSKSLYAAKIRHAEETAKKEIAKLRHLAQAQRAYDEADKYAVSNPDDMDGQWRRWRNFLTDYQESPLVADASAKIERVRQDMGKRAMESFNAALTQADILATKGKFHTAAKILEKYEQGVYNIKIKTQAIAIRRDYQRKKKVRFRDAKMDFDQALRGERYGEAIGVCNKFIAIAEEKDRIEEIKKLLEIVGHKADQEYKSGAAKTHGYFEDFDFVNAESLTVALSEKLKDTPADNRASALIQRVNAVRQLHSKTVEKIEKAKRPKLLPFTIETVGRGKAVGATMERLLVGFGELQQDLLWTKFTKDEVFQVYRMFLDERFKENQDLLKHFAQEFKIEGKYYQP